MRPAVTIEYDVFQMSISGSPVLRRFSALSGSSPPTQVEPSPDASAGPPKRYSIGLAPLLTIRPGGNLSFSVPLDPVRAYRHLHGPKPLNGCHPKHILGVCTASATVPLRGRFWTPTEPSLSSTLRFESQAIHPAASGRGAFVDRKRRGHICPILNRLFISPHI